MPKANPIFAKSAILGYRDGHPIVKTEELIRLGVPVVKTKKSQKSPAKKAAAAAPAATGSERPKRNEWESFNEALDRFRNKNKNLKITREEKKAAWERSKTEGTKSSIKGYTELFTTMWN